MSKLKSLRELQNLTQEELSEKSGVFLQQLGFGDHKAQFCVYLANRPPMAEYQQLDSTLVVYTPAIPKNMGELVYVQQAHTVLKRSEVLGLITQTSKGLGVAGTHGKTTTSTMLAYVLSQSHLNCSAFLGGISSNFNSNVLVEPDAVYSVIEADEFDRSFLRLTPYASIITAMDPDHLDIYGDESQLHESFHLFANQLKDNGKLFIKDGLPIHGITYSVAKDSQLKATNIRVEQGNFVFDFQDGYTTITGLTLGMAGKHNVENAVAAIGVALSLGIHPKSIKALKTQKIYDELQPKIDSIFRTDSESGDILPASDSRVYDAKITGNSVIYAFQTAYLQTNLIESTITAIILICILMALLFRSWKMVVISTVPSLIPLIITAGLMGFFHIALKPSTILIFSIAFGISSDGTIYFLTRYKEEWLKNSNNVAKAVVGGCPLVAYGTLPRIH